MQAMRQARHLLPGWLGPAWACRPRALVGDTVKSDTTKAKDGFDELADLDSNKDGGMIRQRQLQPQRRQHRRGR